MTFIRRFEMVEIDLEKTVETINKVFEKPNDSLRPEMVCVCSKDEVIAHGCRCGGV
jgi:hypothetical protein